MNEIIVLEWTDIDFKRNVIVVQCGKVHGTVGTIKSDRSRIVPTDDEAAAGGVARAPSPAWPAGARSGRRTDRDLRGTLALNRDGRTPERRANMKVTGRIHILRHTYCSHLAMQGAPARAI
jgi:integrase